jgi:hypothetical protein
VVKAALLELTGQAASGYASAAFSPDWSASIGYFRPKKSDPTIISSCDDFFLGVFSACV